MKGVKGTGITLGVTDGTDNMGFQCVGYTPGYNVNPCQIRKSMYGTDVGTTTGFSEYGNSRTIGVTTDSSKSGIISDISSTVNYAIKY